MVLEAIGKAGAKAGVANRAVFYDRDLHETDISQADVLTIYLLPEVNLMVRPQLLATLKPGTRVVSHVFDMGKAKPRETVAVHGRTVYMWTTPIQ